MNWFWKWTLVTTLICSTTAAPPARPGEDRIFELDIQEDGSDFKEFVDIDVEKNMEIMDVPSHNDVNGAIYIHDFNTNMTLRREKVDGRCFLTDLSRDIEDGIQPRPRDMVAAMKRPHVSTKSRKIRIIVNKWVIDRPVTEEERSKFNEGMTAMCDGRATYRLAREENTIAAHEVDESIFVRQSAGNTKRQYGPQCSIDKSAARCILKMSNCRYTAVTCERTANEDQTKMIHGCNSYNHIYDSILCCIDCCTDQNTSDPIHFPFCGNITMKEHFNTMFNTHCDIL